MQPGRPRQIVTAALALGMFMAAFEGTAVATAMPTAIADLGGVGRYSWAFSAYLLTSTTTVPLYSKLADLYGRRSIFLLGVVLFLLGSGLSGASQSLNQLIAFRALQGLGAGAVNPVAITIVGDIYSLEERGRVQGVFSGVWGVASIIGPALGGLITDVLSWRWVFYINIPFGIASAVLLQIFFVERVAKREHALDVTGTIALTGGVTFLLIAMLEGSSSWGLTDARTIAMVATSIALLLLFVRQERRTPEPMLPPVLFTNRVIAVANLGGVMIGSILYAATAYVPMFAQGVLGGNALDAGLLLAPMSIAWPVASTLAGHLLIRVEYRRLAIVGGVFALIGAIMLAFADMNATRFQIIASMSVAGFGMGLMATPYLVAVQNAVPWNMRGAATGSTQFFRTIGGAIAVAAFGALLNGRLRDALGPGLDVNAAINPVLRKALTSADRTQLVSALADGLHAVYVGFAIVAACALVIAFRFPRGSATSHVYKTSEEVT